MNNKTISPLWSRWIIALCVFLIIYGLAMAFAPQAMGSTLVAPMFYGNNEPLRSAFVSAGEPEQSFYNVLNGVLGAVTAGWFVQTIWIAAIPFRRGERWAWYALAAGVVAWAALEFLTKLLHGVSGLGLVAHFGLAVMFAIPLLATYQQTQPP